MGNFISTTSNKYLRIKKQEATKQLFCKYFNADILLIEHIIFTKYLFALNLPLEVQDIMWPKLLQGNICNVLTSKTNVRVSFIGLV